MLGWIMRKAFKGNRLKLECLTFSAHEIKFFKKIGSSGILKESLKFKNKNGGVQ